MTKNVDDAIDIWKFVKNRNSSACQREARKCESAVSVATF